MNLIMQGGTGFYSLTVVETPEDVIDASQQISIMEMESLGYQNVKNGSVYQVTRDVFDPNNNQGCYFIISSPVGFRFSQQEVITNNSNEYRSNRDWSFQVSCMETLLYNPAIGPPGNQSQNWLFKATSWSDLTVNLQYINKNQNGYLETSQTRFSPYQTFFYSGIITPVVSVNGGRLFQSIETLVGAGSIGTNTYSGTQFLITMSDSTQWLLFTSTTFSFSLGYSINYQVIPDGEALPPPTNNFLYIPLSQATAMVPPLTGSSSVPPKIGFEYQYFSGGSSLNALISTSAYVGTVRFAKIPNGALNSSYASNIQQLLITYAPNLPTNSVANVVHWIDASGITQYGYQFQFDIQNVLSAPSPPSGLLFAYSPYLLSDVNTQLSPNCQIYSSYPSFYTNRGYLTFLSTSSTIVFQITAVADQYFSNEVKFQAGINQITAQDITTLQNQLIYDQKWINVSSYYDTYTGAKEMLLKAELNLYLAKVLQDQGQSPQSIYNQLFFGLNQTKWSLTRWMDYDSFIYDESWGGMVSTWGYLSKYNDYSNIMYQDHNFHYGYFVMAASIVAYIDNLYLPPGTTAWIDEITSSGVGTNADLINCLIRDVMNPSSQDPSFPKWRFVDWEEGHSRPMGMFPTGSGGNEESTAEDMNFYYGVMRWGNITGNSELNTLGKVFASRIAKAAKYLWQVGSQETIYQGSQQTLPSTDPQGVNEYPCVGIIWDGKADPQTWFLGTDYCEVGIQSITTLPSMLLQLEDPVWTTRMVDYFMNPTVASQNWHIWSIPANQSLWYSIVTPLLSSQYPSGARIVWNSPQITYDTGNSRGTILFDILYFQSLDSTYLIPGPYSPLNPAQSGYPTASGFALVAQQQYIALTEPEGPIVAYSNDFETTPSINTSESLIKNNSLIIGVDPKLYPTPASWAQLSYVFLFYYNVFNAAYDQEVTATEYLPESSQLSSWQHFATFWNITVTNDVDTMQQECVNKLEYYNSASNLCVANMNAMMEIGERITLGSCVDLLGHLAEEYNKLSANTFPPASQSTIMVWSERTLYNANFTTHYPGLSSGTPTAQSCITNFCDFSYIRIPPKFA